LLDSAEEALTMTTHRRWMRSVVLAGTVAAALIAGPAVADDADTRGTRAPGEPTVPDDRNRPLPERYTETPGAHSERPGKHSSTVGRHGTTGEVGGGVDAQSGSEADGSDEPILERRQREAGEDTD
jgi:hypothetical protein